MTVAYGGSAEGEAETDNGRADCCSAKWTRREWRALTFAWSKDSAALKAGLEGNIIRATQLEKNAPLGLRRRK